MKILNEKIENNKSLFNRLLKKVIVETKAMTEEKFKKYYDLVIFPNLDKRFGQEKLSSFQGDLFQIALCAFRFLSVQSLAQVNNIGPNIWSKYYQGEVDYSGPKDEQDYQIYYLLIRIVYNFFVKMGYGL